MLVNEGAHVASHGINREPSRAWSFRRGRFFRLPSFSARRRTSRDREALLSWLFLSRIPRLLGALWRVTMLQRRKAKKRTQRFAGNRKIIPAELLDHLAGSEEVPLEREIEWEKLYSMRRGLQ